MSAADRQGVLALAVAQTVVWAGVFYSFPALVPAVAADTGWDPAAVAGIFSAALLAAAVSAPLCGLAIDRGLGPRMLPGAAALGGVLLLLVGFSPNFWVFGVLWVLIGFTYSGALYDPAFTILTRAYGAAARGPITTVTLIAGFAGTLSFPLNAWLAGIGGWRLAIQGMAALVLLVGVPLMAFAMRRVPTTTDPPPERTVPPVPLRRSPRFWALLTAFFALYLYHGAVTAHILPLLADRGISPGHAVLAAAMIGPMQVVGRLLLMTLGGSRSERLLATLAWAAVFAALVAIALAKASPGWVVVFVVLHGAGNGVMSILRPLLIRSILGPESIGRKAGIVSSAVAAGAAVAPAAATLVVLAGGYAAMLAGLAGVLCLGFVAMMIASIGSGES